jgi:hypothetical protein
MPARPGIANKGQGGLPAGKQSGYLTRLPLHGHLHVVKWHSKMRQNQVEVPSPFAGLYASCPRLEV